MPKVTKIHDPLNQAPPLRVTETKEHRTKKNRITGASILVRCGCCKEKLRIYHDPDSEARKSKTWQESDSSLEINGVNGTVAQWRKILLPLLNIEP